MATARPSDHAFHWWGLPWTPPHPRTLAELVELGMIGADNAQFLAQHVGSGGSLVVAAGPSGAGKSTLAHALSMEIPGDRSRAYIRGTFEPFDWVADFPPAFTTLLVNEISPHLPVYSWGESAREVLRYGAHGYQVIATIHADSVDELADLLQTTPIQATAAEVVALDVVVFLDTTAGNSASQRRISSLMQLEIEPKSGKIRGRDLPV